MIAAVGCSAGGSAGGEQLLLGGADGRVYVYNWDEPRT